MAGTSAGALNGALWGRNALLHGFEIWKNLTFDSIYPVRLKKYGVPNLLIWLISTGYLIANLIYATFLRLPHQAAALSAALCTLIAIGFNVLLVLAIFQFYYGEHRPIPDEFWVWKSLFVIAIILFSYRIYRSLRKNLSEARIFLELGPPFFIFNTFFVLVWIPGDDAGANRIALTIAVAFLSLVVWITITLSAWAFRHLIQSMARSTIFSSSPLRSIVEEVLEEGEWHTQVIATCAKSCDILDLGCIYGERSWEVFLDQERLRQRSFFSLERTDQGIRTPSTERIWDAVYEDVSELESPNATDILVASAALPFGLVPPVELEGHLFVDGGVIDNVPLLPLLDWDLDEIVIVLLEPYPDEEAAISSLGSLEERWVSHELVPAKQEFAQTRIHESLIVETSFDLQESIEAGEEALREEFRALKIPNIRVISPPSKLGGLRKGTLRFESTYARELMRCGFRAACELEREITHQP